ncbi:acyltransferase family protein [Trinickia dinghuensis]|uniref:Acyltransferase n=1 Tax=Trinickia dinghuensis TaxID=2291023 RepID=A0A3D8JT53_9BURK|nr:acyltransferase [Trinickia dinghuensis]RDU96050.1 acyltransferase [Trinickia dinghuensis]
MRSANIKYLPEVDHLRALAAVLIVFFHGFQLFLAKIAYNADPNISQWVHTTNPLLAVIVEGHTAVALFMVLTGFIFTYGTYDAPFSTRLFLVNRVLRIYPLFVALILAGIVVYPSNFSFLGLLQTLFLFANFPGALDVHEYSNIFWSISVEFQFYLIFPVLIFVTRKRGIGFLVQLVAVAIAFRMLIILSGGRPNIISYSYINGRIDQFVLGMLAAFALRKGLLTPARCRWLLAPAAASVIAILYGFHRLGGFPLADPWKIVWPTIEGGMWALLVASYVGASLRMPALVSWILCKIGERSFSIYLLHFVLLTILVKHNVTISVGRPGLSAIVSTAVLLLPVTLALSALTYSTIEEPFLNLRKRYIEKQPAVAPPEAVESQ